MQQTECITTVLVVRGDDNKRLASMGTAEAVFTKHGKMANGLHRLVSSLFNVCITAKMAAVSIDVIPDWYAGMDLSEAIPVFIAKRVPDACGMISYSVLESVEEVEA